MNVLLAIIVGELTLAFTIWIWPIRRPVSYFPTVYRDDIAERFLGPHAYENDGWVRDGLQ